MPFDSTTPEALPDVRPGYAEGRAALYRAGAFFLAHPEGHCKESVARNDRGMTCEHLSPKAVQWCAAGRLLFELGLRDNNNGPGTPGYAAFDLIGKALRAREPNRLDTLVTWNDCRWRKPTEVADLLMAAAALYEEPCAPATVHTIVYEEDTHAA